MTFSLVLRGIYGQLAQVVIEIVKRLEAVHELLFDQLLIVLFVQNANLQDQVAVLDLVVVELAEGLVGELGVRVGQIEAVLVLARRAQSLELAEELHALALYVRVHLVRVRADHQRHLEGAVRAQKNVIENFDETLRHHAVHVDVEQGRDRPMVRASDVSAAVVEAFNAAAVWRDARLRLATLTP